MRPPEIFTQNPAALIMTPGPTQVRDNVRLALSLPVINSDLDEAFLPYYQSVCKKVGEVLKTRSEVLILCGEGMLGLEAACVSLMEAGDEALVIGNGVFGDGFEDLVRMSGAKPVMYQTDWRSPVDPDALDAYLCQHEGRFACATLVHGDTPSGILNDVSRIGPLLYRHGILSIVDCVSTIGGDELDVDAAQIDICLTATQKCLSAPTGLSMLSISERALNRMKSRKSPINSIYCNLSMFYDAMKSGLMAYTMPVHEILALDAALDNFFNEGAAAVLARHGKVAAAAREAVIAGGLTLYPLGGFANGVSAVCVPENVDAQKLLRSLRHNHNVLLAGSYGKLSGKVIRIGHMGENCRRDHMAYALWALEQELKSQGYTTRHPMAEVFMNAMQ